MAKKILIVDDSGFMRVTLRDILTASGYEVIGEAGNGEEAITKIKELHPDLVTLDVVMPGVSGLEALQKIIQLDPIIKILMVTAMGKQALVIEAIQAGAKGFLMKPFDPTAVIAEVKRILGE